MPLSHELHTPLNAILGNAELLLAGLAGPLSPQARACLAEIQAAGQHLTQQTQALLLLCQALAAPAAEAVTQVDLVECFRRGVRAGSARRGGRLEVSPGEARFVLRGDPFWLDALAAALLELSRAAGAERGALRLTLGTGGEGNARRRVLHVAWQRIDLAEAPAAPLQLIAAIVRMHGGEVERSEDGGLDLCWPDERVVEP